MVKATFEPPKCPYCGANLFRVVERNRIVYAFKPEEGRFIEVDGEAEMECPECHADLYDLFPDGVCNFVSNSGEKP
ncbi:MAG: hypothetical protein QW660_05990 [Candidatus Bathyarchaeia archaeon]